VVHSVAATAAYADDLDDAVLLFGSAEVEDIYFFHCFPVVVGDVVVVG
jgi:hypothetical protein